MKTAGGWKTKKKSSSSGEIGRLIIYAERPMMSSRSAGTHARVYGETSLPSNRDISTDIADITEKRKNKPKCGQSWNERGVRIGRHGVHRCDGPHRPGRYSSAFCFTPSSISGLHCNDATEVFPSPCLDRATDIVPRIRRVIRSQERPQKLKARDDSDQRRCGLEGYDTNEGSQGLPWTELKASDTSL